MSDPVNHPSHYATGAIECIDALKSTLTAAEFRGFCLGNAMKYLWRCQRKGGPEDLDKAQWYIERLKAELRPADGPPVTIEELSGYDEAPTMGESVADRLRREGTSRR